MELTESFLCSHLEFDQNAHCIYVGQFRLVLLVDYHRLGIVPQNKRRVLIVRVDPDECGFCFVLPMIEILFGKQPNRHNSCACPSFDNCLWLCQVLVKPTFEILPLKICSLGHPLHVVEQQNVRSHSLIALGTLR